MAPDKALQYVAEIETELLTVIEFDVGTDDRFCHPLARHGIQVSSHTCIHTKVLVKSEVSITTVIGRRQLRIHRRTDHRGIGIVIAEGM